MALVPLSAFLQVLKKKISKAIWLMDARIQNTMDCSFGCRVQSWLSVHLRPLAISVPQRRLPMPYSIALIQMILKRTRPCNGQLTTRLVLQAERFPMNINVVPLRALR